MWPQYSHREKVADRWIHMIGVPAGLAGSVVLIMVAAVGSEWTRLLSVILYGLGLVIMLTGSAAYNIAEHPRHKERLRRLDHSGIFVMIAGTYTPFTLVSVGGLTGTLYCVAMWLVAALGVTMKFRYPRRFEGVSIALYLVMGWSVVIMAPEFVSRVPETALWLLAIGGILYTLGVVFHLSQRMRFHNALWHGFVLAAASLHYAAVLHGVALA